ncbi:unnamed protein product [Lymnaea stagnalis]|uniref:Uncharacterized protein n=1 Tax=Lymnaea stagnalis TaxID=6523 RepID=A0AAV2I528_LYMST
MMGALVSRLANVWRVWGSNPSDPVDDPYKQYANLVVETVEKGDCEKLKSIQEDVNLRKFGGVENVTIVPSLMQRAAAGEHLDVIKYLISLGVDVDQEDSCNMTALHEACKRKSLHCVQELVKRSRNIDRKDVWGRTPLIKCLVYRNIQAALLLLERGANPNAVDIYGMTPVSTAINYNMLDMLRVLVNHGADINMVTQHLNNTCLGPPLYQAVNNKSVELVLELLRLGATTQPRQGSSTNWPSPVSSHWQYYISGQPNPVRITLQHENAVMMAMNEMVRRGNQSIDGSSQSMEILHILLAAHGYSLGSTPDVLIRVLINSSPEHFSKLLHKLQVCSSSQENLLQSAADRDSNQRLVTRSQHLHQMDYHLNGPSGGKKAPRFMMSLENQARRVVRQAVMTSGHNVFWATSRLQCPPALKSLLLLKDIDRAFSHQDVLGKPRVAVS